MIPGPYTPPRTAWGDPDLQGQWNSQTATPLERPLTGELAGKETLTDEEWIAHFGRFEPLPG